MLLVDNRAGSQDLVEPLQKMGLEAVETVLDAGDVAFQGKDGHWVGIEFKKLPDLVTSLRDGRLIETQAAKMLGPKGYFDFAWLLIEGRWRVSSTGQLIVPRWYKRKETWVPIKGGMPASEMVKRLLTLEILGGFHVRFTNDRAGSLAFINYLYRWFVDKSLDDHTTLLTPHVRHGFVPISDFRAILVDRFPGIGLKGSKEVEQHFAGSLRRASHASVEEWAGIVVNGKRLGIQTAEKIDSFLRGTV